MTRKNNTKIISVVHPICCGLDVHKNMVSASIIITDPDGEQTVARVQNDHMRALIPVNLSFSDMRINLL